MRVAPVHARRARADSVAAFIAVLALAAPTGCSRALARENVALTRHVAADSASLRALQQQIAVLQAQCRADSITIESDRAAQRALASQAAASPAPDSLVRARDAQIATLKDQLAKANAELDRIKRRLANPRP